MHHKKSAAASIRKFKSSGDTLYHLEKNVTFCEVGGEQNNEGKGDESG